MLLNKYENAIDIIIPKLFFLKSDGDIVIPSACPSVMLSPPKPLDEIQWGMQQQKEIGHAPWGPGEGSKGQIALNYNN